MPTDTWTNLAPPRRDRVLAAARAEFAVRGFSQGSLNVIAREAGVAKGSLFQYFDDKLDLFTFVCEDTSRRIRTDMEREIARLLAADPDLPFFDLLTAVLRAWVRYFAAHPVDRGVTAATNLEIDADVRAAVRGVAGRHYVEALRPLLAGACQRGDLRPGTDADALLAHLVLLAPHVALAPYLDGLDPVLGLYGADPARVDDVVARLVGPLQIAYAAPGAPGAPGAPSAPSAPAQLQHQDQHQQEDR